MPKHIANSIREITVHGLLAATFTLEAEAQDYRWREWRAVWPSKQDFQESHPLEWDIQLQDLLPPAAKGLEVPTN